MRKNEPSVQPLLSVQGVANYLGVSRQSVYTYIYQHGLPSITVGGIRRVHPDSLQAWLREREQTRGSSRKREGINGKQAKRP